MTAITRPRCPQCVSPLRRGREPGQRCDPCQEVGPDPRRKLPADFYQWESVLAWLAAYDFGPFFLLVRELTGWSQQTLAGSTGLTQAQISAVERGEHRLRDITDVASLAQALQIPPALLGFPDIRATVSQQEDPTQKRDVSWVDRRDFGQHVAALVLGIAGAAGLDVGRLLALLPQAEPAGTRHVGVGDVEFIEQITAAFLRQDFAHGGGLLSQAAVEQVHMALPLLNAQIASELRPRLMMALGRLAMQAGWMSFECNHHEMARRLWLIGLHLARHTDHSQATDLTVFLLLNMADQSVHLGYPDEAQHLTRVGETAAVGRHPVSASTFSVLANIQARARAAQGDAAGCDRALGQGIEHLSSLDPATAPPYSAFLDETHLASYRGVAYYTLALPGRDARAAGRAVPLLRHAVDHLGPDYARPRASCLPDLAGAHALTGDLSTAVTVGHQAVDAITPLSLPRAYDRLRTLQTVLAPLHTSPGVAELRDRIATIAA